MARLFRDDLANVEAGIYPLPADHDGSLAKLVERSRLFFADLPDVHRRRESGGHRQVLNDETRGRRPGYYLQNFHFQSGGWMTDDSAQRYDTQVEVLFYGTANAIRRQALPPLQELFAGRDQRRLRLLDVGCGTGRFLDFCKQAWPRLPAIGLDLSEAYVGEARRHLKAYFVGDLKVFTLRLDFRGTDFQKSVWEALLTIPFGETRSYSDIACQIAKPKASRAVGAANGRNPISIIAPCHRVIGSNGALTGFAGGIAAKEYLLRLERT